jgi:hypothetical protein
MQAKLNEVKAELRRRMHDPIPEVGKWLRSVVSGHIRYYGVPRNGPAPRLSLAGGTALASRPISAQLERTGAMGSYETPNRPLAAPSPHCSSLSLAAADRPYLRQEPDAGKPPVRICGGGHEQS